MLRDVLASSRLWVRIDAAFEASLRALDTGLIVGLFAFGAVGIALLVYAISGSHGAGLVWGAVGLVALVGPSLFIWRSRG